MAVTARPTRVDATTLQPIGVGGDIGVYAMMRAFHEQYGTPAVVLSAVATRAMADSSFITNVVVPGIDQADILIPALERLADQHQGKVLVLLTNADWFVRAIIENRERLGARFVLPYCTLEVLDTVSRKESFAQVCGELNIPTPKTVNVDIPALAAAGGLEAFRSFPVGLDFPIVAKPSDSAAYHYVDFPGKSKIHYADTRAELDELIGALLSAGYTSTFLLQEFIPGDETHMRSLTAYRDSGGEVTLLATGQVLLEEHTPGTLGVPASILTQQYPDAMEAATLFLKAVDYHGFANFDYKLDPRTGQHVYFEMNPRIGRNNYYVTAAGVNPARAVVEDLVLGHAIEPMVADREVLYSVVPVGLLSKYILDPKLAARVQAAGKAGVANPLKYSADSGLKRRIVVEAMTQNHRRKYARHYPKPSETGR